MITAVRILSISPNTVKVFGVTPNPANGRTIMVTNCRTRCCMCLLNISLLYHTCAICTSRGSIYRAHVYGPYDIFPLRIRSSRVVKPPIRVDLVDAYSCDDSPAANNHAFATTFHRGRSRQTQSSCAHDELLILRTRYSHAQWHVMYAHHCCRLRASHTPL